MKSTSKPKPKPSSKPESKDKPTVGAAKAGHNSDR
ncbi:hypothetical protein RUE5091_00261 [Ruegeria denitrificans]|uniref:Uncharacterized protein n=1 Tax=Ruegeria denitrificans TaxID=1715692 RepID=A0A0P1I1K8_9RHOB|nr:hypothetical protein RUE5091_00261 [Ruegeria denitrificans]